METTEEARAFLFRTWLVCAAGTHLAHRHATVEGAAAGKEGHDAA